ncbi:MAG TPA: type VI secretion system membrane subunit TssM [Rhizobacter sp.]|nr:type VI secretion system membrane subunit TssM [Rhizobacter sp.]
MQRLWQFLLDARTLAVIGLLALAALLFMSADALKVGAVWVLLLLLTLATVWFVLWALRRHRARKAGQQLEAALDAEAERAIKTAPNREGRAEMMAVRSRMQEAVKTIKTSKLGQTSGSAALYELPWYAVIGNPAAGKSTAVVRSGLNFPFFDKNTSDKTSSVIQGIGGTRNCDWFFTTEGILLDTAGRYSVHEEDRAEWLGFLSLLKRNRPKAPLNGVIIAASLAELANNRPEFAITLAKQLRQRVQELTEKLEVFAPVYVVFTKTDLISGFAEFFEDRDRDERERVWGATLPYDPAAKSDVVASFERHFDELNDGLKEASIVRMSMHRGEKLPPGVLTFPLEFNALKAPLRTFITTLFEDNPYQFRPVFRGFYFTSAVQEGQSTGRASQRVAERFALTPAAGSTPTAAVVAQNGFFLRDLFSKVIFADRNLVQQYTSRSKLRWRYAAFFGGALLLGAMLAGWTWSYVGNRQLVANVQADLNKAIKLQEGRIDLQSRLEALEIVQDRVEQLQRYRDERPWSLTLGLYQGDAVEQRLRATYLAGLQEVMLKPTAAAIASYLSEVNANAAQLQPLLRTADGSAPPRSGSSANLDPQGALGVYSAASTSNVSDAYNALKTYVMLGDHSRIEAGHLGDQLTRFWRGWLEANRGSMPREQLIRSAERILSFALTQVSAPDFPVAQTNLALLDTTRENLRRVVKGMPARERVYAEIKARAATRYPPMTVARLVEEADKDIVAGSYAISGAFTREAWDGFIDDAFKDASTKESKADDWVLKTATQDDLTLEGSPEQIRKALVQLYKAEYVQEWQKFMQGVSVKEFGSFEQAVSRMNRLGDPAASPVGKLIQTLYDQTSWDNPGVLNEKLAKGQKGFIDWFKQSILRMSPGPVEMKIDLATGQAAIPMGPIGKEFAGLTRLVVSRDSNPTLLRSYLLSLSKIRTRFNQIKNQGDHGPASRQLMQQTLEGGSELSEALKLVEEQMLNGQTDAARATLRPLLVRPLIQSYAVIVPAAETEINRVWVAQVHEPFQRTLAGKYPFDKASRLEASAGEMAKMFGPEGGVAKFSAEALGSLVVRRGDTITPRTWADIGLHLRPEFASGFPAWVAPIGGQAAAGGGGAAGNGGAGGDQQTHFQMLPTPVPGLSEYTIEVDGQQLRYRNAMANWTNFVWPGQGAPGVRISGITTDGRPVEFLSEPGGYGLEKMINKAKRRKLDTGAFELTWANGPLAVTVQLRLISSPAVGSPTAPGSPDTPSASGGLKGVQLPAQVVGVLAATPALGASGARP